MIENGRWNAACANALTDDQIVSAVVSRDVTLAELRAELNEARPKIEGEIADVYGEEQSLPDPGNVEDGPNAPGQIARWLSAQPDPTATVVAIRDLKKKPREERKVARDHEQFVDVGLDLLLAEAASRPDLKKPESAWTYPFLVFLLALLLSVIAIPGSLLVFLIRDGWGHVLSSVGLDWSATKIAALIMVISFVGGLISAIGLGIADAPFDQRTAAAANEVLEYSAKAGEFAQRDQGQRELQLKLRMEAVRRTDLALMERIAAHLRNFIDVRRAPSYLDELPDIDLTNGLAEVLNSQNIVDTTSRDELVSLMQTMPGGSIGLAGPRGAGKTTIITQLTQLAELKHNDGSGPRARKVLGIFTSAPVQYDGREFILHLFSAVCDSVLKPQPRSGNARSWETAFDQQAVAPPSRFERPIRATLAQGAFVTMIAAAALAALGFASLLIPKPSVAPQTIQVEINGNKVIVPPPAATAAPSATVALLQRLGLQPLPLFVTALQCLIASLLLRRYLAAVREDRDRQQRPPEQPRRPGRDEPSGEANNAEAWAAVTAAAAEWDLELRYQQSFTSGWSGALKLPIGVEAAMTRSASLVARQLTFPELAKAFREFLATLAPWYVVVIGIDELDKIATAEKAQQFVNEVKAVFGVRGVFYLVSVSDSAISSFARRGLAVRDAFDSAFDEIVRVGYLDHLQAKSVLSRRVIGLSEPVVGFCHCLSGGLPRDLIRACRALFNESARTGSRKLAPIAGNILRRDLLDKIDGSITHVLDLGAGSAGTAALVQMRAMRRAVEDRGDLHPAAQSLIEVATRMADDATKSGDAVRRAIADTAADLAIYAVYCVTLRDAFTKYPSQGEWQAAADRKVFADIASFRRALSLNSLSANAELGAFRTVHGMNALLLP